METLLTLALGAIAGGYLIQRFNAIENRIASNTTNLVTVDENIQRHEGWINFANTPVMAMYQMFGQQPAGIPTRQPQWDDPNCTECQAPTMESYSPDPDGRQPGGNYP